MINITCTVTHEQYDHFLLGGRQEHNYPMVYANALPDLIATLSETEKSVRLSVAEAYGDKVAKECHITTSFN